MSPASIGFIAYCRVESGAWPRAHPTDSACRRHASRPISAPHRCLSFGAQDAEVASIVKQFTSPESVNAVQSAWRAPECAQHANSAGHTCDSRERALSRLFPRVKPAGPARPRMRTGIRRAGWPELRVQTDGAASSEWQDNENHPPNPAGRRNAEARDRVHPHGSGALAGLRDHRCGSGRRLGSIPAATLIFRAACPAHRARHGTSLPGRFIDDRDPSDRKLSARTIVATGRDTFATRMLPTRGNRLPRCGSPRNANGHRARSASFVRF